MNTCPVIGIAGASYVVPRFWGELPVSGASTALVAALSSAGAAPVILPLEASALHVLGSLDGLVLAGGADLDPQLYGSTSSRAMDVDRTRDDAEISLLRLAHTAQVPMLGLCRGAQIMAVGFGGSLVPHLGDHNPHVIPGGSHLVTTAPGSLSQRLLGERAMVNSLHHQAVLDPGAGWRTTAHAEDGVAETIEWVDSPWHAFGVQWHPELAPDDPISQAVFGWLVEAATRRSWTRASSGRSRSPDMATAAT